MPHKRRHDACESTICPAWLDQLPTPIFILDQKGKLHFCNAAVEKLTGHPRRTLIGTGLDVYIAPSDAQRFLRDELKLFRGMPLVRVSYTLLRRNGDLVHTVANVSPIFDATHQKVQFIIGLVLESA